MLYDPRVAILWFQGCSGGVRPLAVDVCALVEQYALQARLFGNSQVECHPDDSEIRQGPMFGVLHRDCQPLRRNSRNLQFIAVLQGCSCSR